MSTQPIFRIVDIPEKCRPFWISFSCTWWAQQKDNCRWISLGLVTLGGAGISHRPATCLKATQPRDSCG